MSRERIGKKTMTVFATQLPDGFDAVLMKCGHWFKVHHGTFVAGEMAGCPGCDGLDKLLDLHAEQIARLKAGFNNILYDISTTAPLDSDRVAFLEAMLLRITQEATIALNSVHSEK